MNKFLFFLCTFFLFPLFQSALYGQSDRPNNAPTSEAKSSVSNLSSKILCHLCSAREMFSEKIEASVMKLDAFLFGTPDDAFSRTNAQCVLKLRVQPQYSYLDGASISAGLSLKVVLPHLQEKVRVFIDNIKRDELPGKDFPNTKPEDNYFHLGFNLHLIKRAILALDADAGLRFAPLPEPFGLIRYSYEKEIWTFKNTISEELFWYRDDGFGETTQWDIERHFFEAYCVRNTLAAMWAQHSKGVEFEETLLFQRKFGENRVGGISGSLFWNKESCWLMNNYRIALKYRAHLYQNWLFYEIQPRLDWDKDNNFKIDPSIRIMFDILFGCK